MLILSFLALIPRALLGFVLVQVIWKSPHPRDVLLKLALAGPIGMGVSSLLCFLWIWAGLDLGIYVILETAVALGLSAWLLWKNWPAALQHARTLLGKLRGRNLFWLVLILLGFLLFTGEFWVQLLPNPHGWWDAWWNWNVVARFIYRGGDHWTGTFLRTGDHPDYPLLVPISNAITWDLLPRESTRGPMALAFFYGFCLVALLFTLLYRLRDGLQASLGALLMITQPFVAFYAMMLFSDLPLSFFFLAGLGLLLLHLARPQPGVAMLAGLAVGLSGWTKNEGLTFILFNLTAWAWLAFSRPGGKAAFLDFIKGLALPALCILGFKLFLAPANDLFTAQQDLVSLLTDVSRYTFIFTDSYRVLHSLRDGSISVAVILITYLLLMGRSRRPRRVLPLLLVVLAQLAVYYLVFLTTPYSQDWHISASIGRLYLHIFPSLVLAAFLWVKSPRELAPKQSEPSYAADD